MIDALTQCRRPMRSLLLLLITAAVGGVLVGASVAFGLCAVVYMVHR